MGQAFIEWNPIRKGLVSDPLEWIWSSARARAGFEKVPVQIDELRWDVAVPGASRGTLVTSVRG